MIGSISFNASDISSSISYLLNLVNNMSSCLILFAFAALCKNFICIFGLELIYDIDDLLTSEYDNKSSYFGVRDKFKNMVWISAISFISVFFLTFFEISRDDKPPLCGLIFLCITMI